MQGMDYSRKYRKYAVRYARLKEQFGGDLETVKSKMVDRMRRYKLVHGAGREAHTAEQCLRYVYSALNLLYNNQENQDIISTIDALDTKWSNLEAHFEDPHTKQPVLPHGLIPLESLPDEVYMWCDGCAEEYSDSDS